MSYSNVPNVIDSYPATDSPRRDPIPADVCEITGTVESIEHAGVSKRDTPFVKLIFRAVTGELYRFTKFDSTREQIEQFFGQQVRALFECSVDAYGNRHKNIVGEFRPLQGASGQQNQHQGHQGHQNQYQGHQGHQNAPTGHSQPPGGSQGYPAAQYQQQAPNYHQADTMPDPDIPF